MDQVYLRSIRKLHVRIFTVLTASALFAGSLTGCKVTARYTDGDGKFSLNVSEASDGRFKAIQEESSGKFRVSQTETEDPGDPLYFIEGDFYGKKIDDEEDALSAVYSIITELGGNENTALEIDSIRPTADGINYYTFRQLEADTSVYGAAVKLIVGADGHILALASSLVPGIDAEKMSEWGITGEEAEKIVLSENSELGLTLTEGATEQTLLPFLDDSSEFYYVWVVYTNNVYPEYDTAYLAHYVDIEGEYLYALPVAEPGNADALSGEGANLAFTGFKAGTWSGSVKKSDGTKVDITVPILVDTETGEEYLGDLKRKILVADYADFAWDDEIDLRKNGKKGFADNELLIYETYIRVYDTYAETGWIGPDGDGSPTLLLMDWIEEDGTVVNNACYAGRQHGFQVFQFNREDSDGESTDVIAHEFTHCLTSTLALYNLYYNDYGAINEAFSDICGNLIEAMLGDTEDTSWMIGEHEINGPYRCMSDPHKFGQPAFVWDVFYVPHPETVSDDNDLGGVHINSSLLNLVAWRLNESGMDLSDQLYYWMNVALALTPRTDYEDIPKLLTWCLKAMDYGDYETVLQDAISEVSLGDNSLPETVPEELGLVRFDFPFADPDSLHYATVIFEDSESSYEYPAWPDDRGPEVTAALPQGDYTVLIVLSSEDGSDYIDVLLTEDGFVELEDEELEEELTRTDSGTYCHVKNGEVLTLDAETLVPILKAAEKRLWSD